MGAEAQRLRAAFDGIDARVAEETRTLGEGGDLPFSEEDLSLLVLLRLNVAHDKALVAMAPRPTESREIATAFEEARARMPGILRGQVFGPTMTSLDAVAADVIAVAAMHRRVIHKLAATWLDDPADATRDLEDAPLPELEDPGLAARLRAATDAHSDAIVVLAAAMEDR